MDGTYSWPVSAWGLCIGGHVEKVEEGGGEDEKGTTPPV